MADAPIFLDSDEDLEFIEYSASKYDKGDKDEDVEVIEYGHSGQDEDDEDEDVEIIEYPRSRFVKDVLEEDITIIEYPHSNNDEVAFNDDNRRPINRENLNRDSSVGFVVCSKARKRRSDERMVISGVPNRSTGSKTERNYSTGISKGSNPSGPRSTRNKAPNYADGGQLIDRDDDDSDDDDDKQPVSSQRRKKTKKLKLRKSCLSAGNEALDEKRKLKDLDPRPNYSNENEDSDDDFGYVKSLFMNSKEVSFSRRLDHYKLA